MSIDFYHDLVHYYQTNPVFATLIKTIASTKTAIHTYQQQHPYRYKLYRLMPIIDDITLTVCLIISLILLICLFSLTNKSSTQTWVFMIILALSCALVEGYLYKTINFIQKYIHNLQQQDQQWQNTYQSQLLQQCKLVRLTYYRCVEITYNNITYYIYMTATAPDPIVGQQLTTGTQYLIINAGHILNDLTINPCCYITELSPTMGDCILNQMVLTAANLDLD